MHKQWFIPQELGKSLGLPEDQQEGFSAEVLVDHATAAWDGHPGWWVDVDKHFVHQPGLSDHDLEKLQTAAHSWGRSTLSHACWCARHGHEPSRAFAAAALVLIWNVQDGYVAPQLGEDDETTEDDDSQSGLLLA